jgi:hypothetical protein
LNLIYWLCLSVFDVLWHMVLLVRVASTVARTVNDATECARHVYIWCRTTLIKSLHTHCVSMLVYAHCLVTHACFKCNKHAQAVSFVYAHILTDNTAHCLPYHR